MPALIRSSPTCIAYDDMHALHWKDDVHIHGQFSIVVGLSRRRMMRGETGGANKRVAYYYDRTIAIPLLTVVII